MITVKFSYENNQIVAFEISGHAESGPYGYDLVCAGVSAVSFGAVNAINKLCEIDMKIVQGNSGYLHGTIPTSLASDLMANVQILLEGMLISLQTIEREYNEFITIKIK